MTIKQNPFHELYLGESVSPKNYVSLFSDKLIPLAGAIYRPGNLVVLGAQGSGKSMHLRLLNFDIRRAYSELGGTYPLADIGANNFVSCGVNIYKSAAIRFGQRLKGSEFNTEASVTLPLMFADYLNCYLINDLSQHLQNFSSEIAQSMDGLPNVDFSAKSLNIASEYIEKYSSLKRYLPEGGTYEDLVVAVRNRLFAYEDYIDFNVDQISVQVHATKSAPGVSFSEFVSLLRESGIISDSVVVFATIDQVDDIMRSAPRSLQLESNQSIERLYLEFQEVIYAMLGIRDGNISYRLALRPSSFTHKNLPVYGTNTIIERFRSFNILDLDELLLRSENMTNEVAREFYGDILERRLAALGYPRPCHGFDLLQRVFGKSAVARDGAEAYGSTLSPRLIPSSYTEWIPSTLVDQFDKLFESSKYEWRLSCAWVLQRLAKGDELSKVQIDGWKDKKWWITDRRQLAALQIAFLSRQRMIWYGADDVVHLSGFSVLPFLFICQCIWDSWLRNSPESSELEGEPWIPSYIQADGIHNASRDWRLKLAAESGSDILVPFIDSLATILRKYLKDDVRMSYPGANGISFGEDDLRRNPDVQSLLDACTDFGLLLGQSHSTREATGRIRIKYYIYPLLVPYYQLPHGRTSEPRYLEVSFVRAVFEKSFVFTSEASYRKGMFELTQQGTLFEDEV